MATDPGLRAGENARQLILKHTRMTVAQGPFTGLHLFAETVGSELLPKLIGSYEMELHDVIEEWLTGDYDVLLDIGCAEGYYAVGFALRWKDLPRRILAFDSNPAALDLTRRVAALNGVSARVECFPECRYETFALARHCRVCVVCDIEGAEQELLNPELGPELRYCDILVEIHDGKGEPRIRAALETRFLSSHECEMICSRARTGEELGALAPGIPHALARAAVDERRSRGLAWMILRTRRRAEPSAGGGRQWGLSNA